MSTILENPTAIAELDQDNLLSGATALPEQIEHAWDAIKKIQFKQPTTFQNVVIAGMGGSGLGADIAITALADRLTAPVQLVQGYDLPNYIDEKSLVILASFSGTTEEILNCLQQAQAAEAQLAVISASGPLLELATQHNLPYYKIEATYNRSSQQRMALGYALFGVIGMLHQAGVYQLEDSEIETVIKTVKDMVIKCGVESKVEDNPAKHLAFELIDREPVLIGAEFLAGAMHTAVNQLNENAKTLANYKVIPEMNHHLLEGLKFPRNNVNHHFFVFVDSELYLSSNHHRLELTQEIVDDLDIPNLTMKLTAETRLAQIFELITVWSFTSIYLALLENINPGPLPVVDSFKAALKQRTTTK